MAVDWGDWSLNQKRKTDFAFECFLNKFNLILDKYFPLKKLTKQKLKFKRKPSITPDIQNCKIHQIERTYFE